MTAPIAEACRFVGAAGQADGRGAQRIPQRRPGIRARGPGVRRSRVPGGGVRANRPRPRPVSRASAAVERPGTPGLGAVRRDRPIRGGGGNTRTNSAGCRAAVTALRAAECAGCMPSDGNAPAAPICDAWLADPQPVKQPAAGATCRIPHCELWPQATSPFCQTHTNTWKVNGRPDDRRIRRPLRRRDHRWPAR